MGITKRYVCEKCRKDYSIPKKCHKDLKGSVGEKCFYCGREKDEKGN
jgi:hypothetical protein